MPESSAQISTLARGWTFKMSIVMLVGLVLGVWGLLDAMVWYPARGRGDAEYKHKVYLERSNAAGSILTSGIQDPAKALEALKAREGELNRAVEKAAALEASGGNRGELASLIPALVDHATLQWLAAADLVGDLKPAVTNPQDPLATLRALQEKWKSLSPPKPLDRYDLPLQWLIAASGLVVAGWMMLLIFRASRTKFMFDQASQTLTLPGGRSFVPADVKEFDKRKWDKFFVTVHLKDGSSHKLDLLRNVGLEEWVLAMEKTAFPESAPDDTPDNPPTPPAPADAPQA